MITANYGLNPLLGKYHQSVCGKCFQKVDEGEVYCPACQAKHIIKGVSTRIKELSTEMEQYRTRPPYIHQVPLDFIPGLGPKMLDRLLQAFGTEMTILHKVAVEDLEKVVPKKLASYIDQARKGALSFEVGGGGKYGKVKQS